MQSLATRAKTLLSKPTTLIVSLLAFRSKATATTHPISGNCSAFALGSNANRPRSGVFVPSNTIMQASGNDDGNEKGGDLPRIDGSEVVGSTKWLRLETLSYTDVEGKERKWDYATRTTKRSKSSADAVVIIPLLKHLRKGGKPSTATGDDDSVLDTLLVEQFRPPVGGSTMEFPAGLIDAGETPEQAALRELREETGYVGEACAIPPVLSPLVCMSPGLCDETVVCVVVTVDLDNPYNDPGGALYEATPDDGEHITIHRVSLREGFRKLLEKSDSPMAIQGLYLFAMGLEIGKSIE